MKKHPDKEVDLAITRLCDALCEYERNSGRNSVLILREEGGWSFRAMGGKPVAPEACTDSAMINLLGRE